jgi:hypothetical protein
MPSVIALGWQLVDPGRLPRTPLLDDPPMVSDPASLPAAHARWRAVVTAAQQKITKQHNAQLVWFPIGVPDGAPVVPVCGGTSAMWQNLSATVSVSAVEAGCRRVTVLNLTTSDVSAEVRGSARSRGIGVRADIISPRGSTVDLFGRLTGAELIELVADMHDGDTGQDRRELRELAARLADPIDLEKLRQAIGLVVRQWKGPQVAALDRAEQNALSDYRTTVVARQPSIGARLDGLHGVVDALVGFRLPAGRAGSAAGPSPIRTVQIDANGVHDEKVARELATRAVARSFADRRRDPETLVIVGAELVDDDLLASLAGTAAAVNRPLVLLFTRITKAAQHALGDRGSGLAVFLKLANHEDAKVAAEYLGREFTFVVNGYSIAEGQTDQWSESEGTNWGVSVSSSVSSSGSSSLTGKALTMGNSFGRTVTSGFSSGGNRSTSQSVSTSRTVTGNVGRQHDYVLQPEVFQNLDSDVMLVVNDRTVVLANADPAIGVDPRTSAMPL